MKLFCTGIEKENENKVNQRYISGIGIGVSCDASVYIMQGFSLTLGNNDICIRLPKCQRSTVKPQI